MLGDLVTDLRFGLTRRKALKGACCHYLGNRMAICVALGRYKLFVPTNDLSLVPQVIINGRWEPPVTRVLARKLRPGMIVADVGANIGFFSIFMADRIGAAGHVFAFEANEVLCTFIRRSAPTNGFEDRITIVPVALGADERDKVLIIPGDNLGGAGVRAQADHHFPVNRPVKSMRLDAYPGAERIELMKIDAEGSEAEIWAGMTGLLAGSALRTVVLEFSPIHYADPAAFLNEVRDAGFRRRRIGDRNGVQAVPKARLLAPPFSQSHMLLLER